jgi:uncharacterized membrane protein
MSTHPPDVQNLAEVYQRRLKRLDRLAITVAKLIGSWSFLLWETVFIAGWMILNLIGWARSWDPYPFILMNLVLSLEAAYTAPLLLMAQNRDAERDRLMMQEDYETNRRAAEEVRKILDALEQHGRLLAKLVDHRESRDGSGPPVAGAPTGSARS